MELKNFKPIIEFNEILKIQFIAKLNQVVLLGIDSALQLSLEIINLNDFSKKTISIDTTNDLSASIDYPNRHVSEFYASDNLDFFYLKCNLFNSDIGTLHFKIDGKGKIVNIKPIQTKNQFNDYCVLKSYLVSKDFIFLDFEDFEQYDLSDFFDDFFEEDDFSFLRTDDYNYSIFTCQDKNILGLGFFDKDGKIPRGRYSVFEIEDVRKPKLIFSHKIDQWGECVINQSCNKVAYFHYLKFGEIDIIVRKLSETEFENEIRFKVDIQGSVPKDVFLTDDSYIIFIFYHRVEVYNIETFQQIFTFKKDIFPPYCFSNNKLFYIYLNKLHIKELI